MSYQTALKIKDVVNNIHKKQYVLPSIQREFVWDTDQIEMLFDSLMRDYPISTFLFWKVDKSIVKNFQFYEFLRKFHQQKQRHNIKIELESDEDVIAILDGQQRMTSLYIALKGSYSKKLPNLRKNNPSAYPKKFLYLNLLKPADGVEKEFDFRYMTEDQAKAKAKDNGYWFKCNKILEFSDISKVMEFLMVEGLTDSSKHNQKESSFALKTLNEFFNVIHQKEIISYYLEEDEELDKVLQIFIRINSGGTKLSYSDLLLSIATAQWKELDAREVIHEFVDELNDIGHGFGFNKDFVLKACLVLGDFKDIIFKVDNFNKTNMLKIESLWSEISKAVKVAVELVAKFGYKKSNLASTNTVIPIAYYIYKNSFENTILNRSERKHDRNLIKEWLARVLMKGTFGGQPDSLYPKLRELINNNLGQFPLEKIISHYKGRRKSILFSEDDVDSILEQKYGSAKSHSALMLLYPGLNLDYKFQQDHIHPKSLFHKKKLSDLNMSNADELEFKEKFNLLPNLQLLQGTKNNQKDNKPFKEWLHKHCSSDDELERFYKDNYIPESSSLEFTDFLSFYNSRKKLLKNELMKILKVAHTDSADS